MLKIYERNKWGNIIDKQMKIQTTFCRIFRERLPEKTTFKVEYEF